VSTIHYDSITADYCVVLLATISHYWLLQVITDYHELQLIIMTHC